MRTRILTEEQIKALQKNENVLRCIGKSITYRNSFKLRAVHEHREQRLTPREIFIKAGFDITAIGRKTPKKCVMRWCKTYGIKGPQALLADRRGSGGHPRIKNLSDKDKIKRLEAQVAYLKKENDFLAKLRAKRAE